MEKMLLKMARQLNAMDEASLMSLWNTYMEKVHAFDGSKDWEESVIVLSLIQAVRGKNQLFNAYLDLMNNPEKSFSPVPISRPVPPLFAGDDPRPHHAAVHQFRPLKKKPD